MNRIEVDEIVESAVFDDVRYHYFTRAALLLKDGMVVDHRFFPSVKFRNITPGNYQVAVRHRNHLGVMTAGSVLVVETSKQSSRFQISLIRKYRS